MASGWSTAVLALLPVLAAAQSTILQIQILEGEGAIHAPGSRVSRWLTVRITDELGGPIQGAAVSFRLAEEGPAGVFMNGLATEVDTSDEEGVAAAPAIRWNSVSGPVRVRVVAVRGQSRAGAVVSQYLSPHGSNGNGAGGHRSSIATRLRSTLRNKLLVVGVVAAGAAGVGFTTGWARGSRGESPKGAEPPRIGPPVISIGRP